MKTFLPKVATLEHKWHLVNAEGMVLGQLATHVANLLRGRHKPIYTPHMDTGDFVIVINAEKVVLTGKKETDKLFMTYSGWKGGEKYESVASRRKRRPELLITHAVKGMIPKNRLGRRIITKLKVFRGPAHPHASQKPAPSTPTN